MSSNPHAPNVHQYMPIGITPNGYFTIYSASEFKKMPEMTWLIDDVLPSKGLASVYGPSGVGKSFFCLDMAASVATGQPWFSHAVKQSRVAYLPLEGRGGFPKRLKAWEAARNESLPERLTIVRELDGFDLGNCNDAGSLADAIIKTGGAGLIIIDTLNKSSPGADENSSTDMGRIIRGATILQEKTGGAVLLIHHPGKNDSRGMRGHSSLYAAMDAVIELREDGINTRWTLVKSKDGENGVSHAFRLEPIEIGDGKSGKSLKSCVIQAVNGAPVFVTQKQPHGKNQKTVLKVVTECLVQQRIGIAASESTEPEGVKHDELIDRLDDSLPDVDPKHRKSRLKEALDGLLKAGFLAMSDDRICLPNYNE